jgi:4-coumarate--CoA ligase
MRRYHPEKYIDYIERYQISETTMVNPMIFKILALPGTVAKKLRSLRFIWCAGMSLGAALKSQLQSVLHQDAIVCQVYGMTEVGGWITTLPYPETDCTGSVGKLLPNIEAKWVVLSRYWSKSLPILTSYRTVDENLNDINEDGLGQILVKGPALMTSYLNNDKATGSTIVNGWLSTGDVGYQKGGKWYIVDRVKVNSLVHRKMLPSNSSILGSHQGAWLAGITS